MASFGTKAETLAALMGHLQQGCLLPQYYFSVAEWRRDQDGVLASLRAAMRGAGDSFIVRSSAQREDSADKSLAGAFKSVKCVPLDNEALSKAVKEVVDSYGVPVNDKDQVLVQPFLRDVIVSGVLFTRDISTLAPYFVINFDSVSGSTDTVTAGRTNAVRTLIKFRNFENAPQTSYLDKLVAVAIELEGLLGSDSLDIEFAVDARERVYVLQVRPIVRNGKVTIPDVEVEKYLRKIYKKVEKLKERHPYLAGDDTIFGVMPDWNPAEMIGVKPRPLPLSLYKELITDRTWAYQRSNYGYRNVRSFPLIVTFLGIPYVDVRVSFNSFIPQGVSDELAEKLTNYYLYLLKNNPASHDKIEFDIIFSCYDFTITRRLQALQEHGFTQREGEALLTSLRQLTKKIVEPQDGIVKTDLLKIEDLKGRQNKVAASKLTNLEKVFWFVEDCKRYGTLPFAGLARAGFIAVQMLNSLVQVGVISEAEKGMFMSSLNTVAKRMLKDQQEMPKEKFLDIYGHLRPGTYDILSFRYDEAYEYYFDGPVPTARESGQFALRPQQAAAVDELLRQNGFSISAVDLFRFLREAIEGREYAKFVFTKSVSEVLRLVKEIGAQYGFSADDMSYVNITTLLNLYSVLDHRDFVEILGQEIGNNKTFYHHNKFIRMPQIIIEPEDIYCFELVSGLPNFIGTRKVRADVLPEDQFETQDLSGKVVFIESADPGYDWIFSRNIGGLVTMYGGANSHMAIRSAELNITAVIGAGEKNFKEWVLARTLEIDPVNKLVHSVK